MEKKQTKLVDIIDILSRPELEKLRVLIEKLSDVNSKTTELYNNSEIMLEVFNGIYHDNFTIHKGLYSELNLTSYYDRRMDIFVKVVISDETAECRILMRRTDLAKDIDILSTLDALFSRADKLLNDFEMYRERLFNDDYSLINTFDKCRNDLLMRTVPHVLTVFNSSIYGTERDIESGTSTNFINTSIGTKLVCTGMVSTIPNNPDVKIEYAEVEHVLTYRDGNKLFIARIASDTQMNFRGLVGMGLDDDRFVPLTLEEQISMYREAIDMIVLYIHTMDMNMWLESTNKSKLS